MDAKIDFTQIESSFESDFTMTYYAFLEIDRQMTAGTEIENLKLQNSGEDFTTIQGFREFMTRISVLPFDLAQLTADQRTNINAIRAYVDEPVDAAPEGINGSDTIDQQIANAQSS